MFGVSDVAPLQIFIQMVTYCTNPLALLPTPGAAIVQTCVSPS